MTKQSSTTLYLSKSLVRKRKAELNRLHKLYSWRAMAKDIYGGEIKFGTLERFATDKKYIPRDNDLLNILGVMIARSPYRILPKWFNRTPEALEFFNHVRSQIKFMYNEARAQQKAKL